MNKQQKLQGFRRYRLKTRLIIAFLMISIIPLLGISSYSYRLYSASLRQKLSASISQTLSMINLNMINEIEKYQYLCGSICISEEIKEGLLNKEMTDIKKNETVNQIQQIIRNKIIYPAQAKNITVYDTDGKIFYNLGYDGFYQEDVDRILGQLKEQSEDVWSYVRTYRDREILVLGRRIYEQYNASQIIGYTLISIDEKIFSETILDPIGLSDSSNIIYLNADGTILSSFDRTLPLGEKVDDILFSGIHAKLPKKTASFNIVKNGEEQLVTYIYNKNLNQFFVYTMPYQYINKEIYTLLYRIIFVAAIVIVLCLLTVTNVYRGIINPVQSMLTFCDQISSGNLSARIKDSHKDEFSTLSNEMNHMVGTIQELMDAQKKQEQQKRELELQMLQYQINPHFLFNTLNSLRFVAAMHNDQMVCEGIQALSSLLQNTLTNKNEYITIAEELENLENYLSILRIRYAGSFDYCVNVTEEHLTSCLVPKLILQPLAENSVMHGSSDDGSITSITVTCSEMENHILLTLSDNGKGFDVTNSTLETHPERKKIGVANVNDRIQLNFGNEYGLQIQSVLGQGTTCILTLPKLLPDDLSSQYQKERN